MSSALLKTALREHLGEEIAALPDEYIVGSDRGILKRVISLKEFSEARNIMIYHSVKREPATLEIAETAMDMGKRVAFPYCYRGGVMEARAVDSLSKLVPSILGIPAPTDTAPVVAPEELELVIVPALTYDFKGYRIGYGGGYYDRFLSGVAAFTVGLARESLMERELPREPHDIAVLCVVTENAVLRTTG